MPDSGKPLIRKLVLINPSERIRKLLHVARLDTLFAIHDTIESALAAEV